MFTHENNIYMPQGQNASGKVNYFYSSKSEPIGYTMNMESKDRYIEWRAGVRYMVAVKKVINQVKLAASVGCSREYINAILCGRKTASSALQDSISSALGYTYDGLRVIGWRVDGGQRITQDWLEDIKTVKNVPGEPPAPRYSGESTPTGLDLRMIPLLGSIPAGWPDSERPPADHIEEWVPALLDVPGTAFALRVKGNSMRRPDGSGIAEGDIVFFLPDEEPIPGQVVVVLDMYGDPVLKRYKLKGDEPALVSDNTAYPPLEMKEGVRVVGVVIKAQREIGLD